MKRAMRVLNDLREPQSVELFVLSVRRMATDGCEGEERLIFQRNCRFLPFFLSLPALPAGRVPRTNNSARYELGIYNYTGAVIGFPLFLPPSFSASLSLLFFGKHRAVPRFSLYRKAD